MLKKYIHLSKNKKAEIKQLISDEFFKFFGQSALLGLFMIILAVCIQYFVNRL